MTPTPTPIATCPDLEGGGTPNVAAADVTCPQNPPVAISTTASLVTQPSHLALLTQQVEAIAPDPTADPPALEFKWMGAPTSDSLRQLRLESHCPGFVVEQAAAVLAGLWEGMTLKRVCSLPGMPGRAVVLWWAKLAPEFGVMLEEAQTALGAVMRDEAGEMALSSSGDPGMVRALLAVASSYDRRIAKGDTSDVNVAQGITVTIQKFGDS